MTDVKPGRPPKDTQRDAREDLLQAAIRSFADRGFRKVALADIASKAGVSIGLIRHYFGSKDGLIAECNRIVSETLGRIFRRMLEGDLPNDGAEFIDELQRRFNRQPSRKSPTMYKASNSIRCRNSNNFFCWEYLIPI